MSLSTEFSFLVIDAAKGQSCGETGTHSGVELISSHPAFTWASDTY